MLVTKLLKKGDAFNTAVNLPIIPVAPAAAFARPGPKAPAPAQAGTAITKAAAAKRIKIPRFPPSPIIAGTICITSSSLQ